MRRHLQYNMISSRIIVNPHKSCFHSLTRAGKMTGTTTYVQEDIVASATWFLIPPKEKTGGRWLSFRYRYHSVLCLPPPWLILLLWDAIFFGFLKLPWFIVVFVIRLHIRRGSLQCIWKELAVDLLLSFFENRSLGGILICVKFQAWNVSHQNIEVKPCHTY
jgi:hypothetical protein